MPILEALGRADRSGTESRDSTEFLLHGVTGSGKTEVYLQAAETTLAQGRSVIILVPEIALTPQALARFQARFGDVVAVMHSGMSAGKRYDEWLRLARGEATVCVGPRSAVFAPLADIGLIVVDEEHESSYKHESDPRYDARTVARRRAQDHGAVLLVGSATPRPESVFGTKRLRLTPARRRASAAGRRDPRHARAAQPAASGHAAGARRLQARGRQGDRPAEPPRLVELPLLRILRTRLDVPELRGRAGAASRPAGYVACHHCGHRERGPVEAAPTAARSRSRATAPAPSDSSTSWSRRSPATSFPVLRLDADAAGLDARARILERFHAAASRRARRHPDGRQGPRLRRRRARRRGRRRSDAAVSGLPRRGAHVRARHPARRPDRAGQRGPRARADDGAGRASDRARRPSRLRDVPAR